MRSMLFAAVLVIAAAGCGGAADDDATTTTEPATSTTAPTTSTAAPTTSTTEAVTTSTSSEPAGDGATITISGFSFGAPKSVAVGGSVTVINDDSVGHTWTSVDGVFSSGVISPDGSFQFTFEDAGEFAFFCSIHPSMTGTITVTG